MVIRDAINNGDIPGPRYLANGKEMARRDGELVAGITAYADGPDEMREVIQHHIAIGVDQIKLSMSGEEVTSLVLSNAQVQLLILLRLQKFALRKTATLPMKRQPPAWKRATSTASDCVPMLAPGTRLRCVLDMAWMSFIMHPTSMKKVNRALTLILRRKGR